MSTATRAERIMRQLMFRRGVLSITALHQALLERGWPCSRRDVVGALKHPTSREHVKVAVAAAEVLELTDEEARQLVNADSRGER